MGWTEFKEAKAKDPDRHEVILLHGDKYEWFECSCGEMGDMRPRSSGQAQRQWASHFASKMGKIDVDTPIGSMI